MISDNIEDFQDCLDQLNEICQKFSLTQKLIIGGDFHEDFSFLLLYKALEMFCEYLLYLLLKVSVIAL